MSLRSINNFIFLVLFFSIPALLPAQWILQNSGTIQALHSIDFINSQTGFAAGNSGTILKTTNGGTNWALLNTLTSQNLNSVSVFNPNKIIACGNSGLIIMTTNSGTNWTIVNSGTNAVLNSVSFYNDSIGICGGQSGTLMWSSNGGTAWNISKQGYISTHYGTYMVTQGVGYSCGVNSIFSALVGKTTNGGANWTYYSFYVQSNEATLRDIIFFNSNEGIAVSFIYNGQGGVSKTTDGGVSWASQIFTYGLLGVDFPSPVTGYAVGVTGYIIKTTNGGTNWTQQASVTSNNLWSVSFVDSLTGYAAGEYGTILKTTNGGVTAIEPVSNDIPLQFNLYQNYPNPFNSSTGIRFDIPKLIFPSKGAGWMTLTIYDLLGKQIAVILDERVSAGTYEINWDASNFTSGIYFYRLQWQNFTASRKLILLK